MKQESNKISQPLTLIQINRVLIVLIIILTFLAGYFHAKAGSLEKKNQLLEEQTVAD